MTHAIGAGTSLTRVEGRAKQDGMRAHALALSVLAGWVLIEVPPGPLNWDDPAIQKAERVRTFDTEENCENFRENALAEDAEMGMNVGLDQDRQMKCVPEDKLKPKAKAPAPAKPGAD